VLARSYPLLDIFWTILEFFIFFLWIFLVITIVIDVFRSHDMSGGVKALWLLFILILPFLGVLIYLIARGSGMHERSVKQAQDQQKAFSDYVAQTAKGANPAEQLATLADLKEKGVITDDEFQAQKAKLLA
jgi:ABC-type multidrug transport system fused ATPase/permease subunit